MYEFTRGLGVVTATCNGTDGVVERESHIGMKTDCEVNREQTQRRTLQLSVLVPLAYQMQELQRSAADLKILNKQKGKRERQCKANFSVGGIYFSTRNYNDLAIATEKKNTMRLLDEVVRRHACQKCVMKKKKKYQLSFPHQKRPFGILCQMQKQGHFPY
jgi:hypothetical protein